MATKKQSTQSTIQEPSTPSEETMTSTESALQNSGNDISEPEQKATSPSVDPVPKYIAGVQCPICETETMVIDQRGYVFCSTCDTSAHWVARDAEAKAKVDAHFKAIVAANPAKQESKDFPVCGSQMGVAADGSKIFCESRNYRLHKFKDNEGHEHYNIHCVECGATLTKKRHTPDLLKYVASRGEDPGKQYMSIHRKPLTKADLDRLNKKVKVRVETEEE